MKVNVDKRVCQTCQKQFRKDIHNGALFYHYELNRYHILAVDLIAPIDYHYRMTKRRQGKRVNARPAGTFDQLILGMGLHLARIHGANNVCLITADTRLAQLVNKCRSGIPSRVQQKLGVDTATNLTGIQFEKESFPKVLNFASATRRNLKEVFGEWPLPIKKKYRGPRKFRPKLKDPRRV